MFPPFVGRSIYSSVGLRCERMAIGVNSRAGFCERMLPILVVRAEAKLCPAEEFSGEWISDDEDGDGGGCVCAGEQGAVCRGVEGAVADTVDID
jgi:hypothetical protein